jgi:hypothetical protein
VDVQELVTRPLPAGEGEEALTFFKGGREELVLLLGKISSLWELEIKPLKILIVLKKMSPDDKGARAPVEDVTLVDVQELVTRPLPAGEGEEALAFFKGGREELVLLLAKISSLWELKIKPLKILIMLKKMSLDDKGAHLTPVDVQVLVTRPLNDKGARAPVEDVTPVDVQALVTRPLTPAGEEEEALAYFKEGKEELLVLLFGKISSLWELKIKPLKILLMLNKMSSLHSVKKMSPISALPRLQHWLDVINSNVLVKVQNSLNFFIPNMTLKKILSKSDKLKETCTLDLKIFSHPILLAHPYIFIRKFIV